MSTRSSPSYVVARRLIILPTVAVLALAGQGAWGGLDAAELGRFTYTNPSADGWTAEPLRLPVLGIVPGKPYRVTCDGTEVPSQVEALPTGDGVMWILADLPAKSAKTWVVTDAAPTITTGPVTLTTATVGGAPCLVLSNRAGVGIAVPAKATGTAIPAPIAGIAAPGAAAGTWLATGATWTAPTTTPLKLAAYTAETIGTGPVFARVRLHWAWDGKAGADGKTPAASTITITVFPGQAQAWVVESHEMTRGSSWTIDLAKGWKPAKSLYTQHGQSPGAAANDGVFTGTLLPGQTRLGDDLVHLIARWSQAFDDGWCFAAADDATAVGAIAVRAGAWTWPYDNLIACRLQASGDSAALVLPTWHGGRTWLLTVGPAAAWTKDALYDRLRHQAWQPLDVLVHRFWLDWPEAKGSFTPVNLVGTDINPTANWRQVTKADIKDVGKPGDLGSLSRVQQWYDADYYGDYWHFSSPENPNFNTDVWKRCIYNLARQKDSPHFAELCRIAEHAFRTDLYHSVTLPGGAGNECPGYQGYAYGIWADLAPVCKDRLGFDPSTWDRFAAAKAFQWHVSQPIAGERRQNPAGDTHPGKGPGPRSVSEFSDGTDPTALVSEELPNFGAVLRNKAGTKEETYVSFKSGPARGHYHGDQLAIHWCAHGNPLAVDHHCSYHPRAGQEHMHNRVSFSTATMPYGNMDGFEHLIAWQPGADADIAVGEVESTRLRPCKELPPEDWDVIGPVEPLGSATVPSLRYRRTLVLVKGGAQDFLVIRDQFVGGVAVTPTFNLHVYEDITAADDRTVSYGDALTIFSAGTIVPTLTKLPWEHDNGGVEKTVGARLSLPSTTAGEFITVLWPNGTPPAMKPVTGGVQVGNDVITFAGTIDDAAKAAAAVTIVRAGKTLTKLPGSAIDLDRSQGDIGLFVPDAGYPFGELPDWLIRQRSTPPAWQVEWEKTRPWPTTLPPGATR